MATLKLNSIFKQVNGKLNKRESTIFRKKKYRAENGAVIGYGAQEAYEVLNPRDYKKNPPKGTELQNINSFADASRLTTIIIQAGKYTDDELAAMTEELREQTLQYREQLAQFKARFFAQLKQPDPQAPVLSKTDPQYNPNSSKTQRRQYKALNTFIRAMLRQKCN
jgi:acyl-homoserine lactone acylase PvdQ